MDNRRARKDIHTHLLALQQVLAHRAQQTLQRANCRVLRDSRPGSCPRSYWLPRKEGTLGHMEASSANPSPCQAMRKLASIWGLCRKHTPHQLRELPSQQEGLCTILCWRGKFCYNELNAPVAQWIEQETSKLLAASSILARGTKHKHHERLLRKSF